jgi:hypothetical protein
VTAGAGVPAALATCSTQQGMCMAACAAMAGITGVAEAGATAAAVGAAAGAAAAGGAAAVGYGAAAYATAAAAGTYALSLLYGVAGVGTNATAVVA